MRVYGFVLDRMYKGLANGIDFINYELDKYSPQNNALKKHTPRLSAKSAFVAYTSLIMVGESKVDDEEQTARTNGRDIWYGRKFVESLTDNELRGLILHEAKHKMYRHLDTWKHLAKINPIKTNMACDYVINLEIVDEGNRKF